MVFEDISTRQLNVTDQGVLEKLKHQAKNIKDIRLDDKTKNLLITYLQ
jgi:hypothetical protein